MLPSKPGTMWLPTYMEFGHAPLSEDKASARLATIERASFPPPYGPTTPQATPCCAATTEAPHEKTHKMPATHLARARTRRGDLERGGESGVPKAEVRPSPVAPSGPAWVQGKSWAPQEIRWASRSVRQGPKSRKEPQSQPTDGCKPGAVLKCGPCRNNRAAHRREKACDARVGRSAPPQRSPCKRTSEAGRYPVDTASNTRHNKGEGVGATSGAGARHSRSGACSTTPYTSTSMFVHKPSPAAKRLAASKMLAWMHRRLVTCCVRGARRLSGHRRLAA